MGEHPAAFIILFIASMVATVGVAGVVTNQAQVISGTSENRIQEMQEDVRTDVTVINDPGSRSSTYDATNETVTVYVKNVGDRPLPTDPNAIDLLVDGRYQTDFTVTVLDGDEWYNGAVARIRANETLAQNETHRVVVRIDGSETLYRVDT